MTASASSGSSTDCFAKRHSSAATASVARPALDSGRAGVAEPGTAAVVRRLDDCVADDLGRSLARPSSHHPSPE